MPWLLKAETDKYRGFTGKLGYFDINEGVAQVQTFLENRFLVKRGFRDITPDDLIHENLAKPRKSIFIVRTGALGDLLMITPFLKDIRRRWPGAKITLATPYISTYHDVFTGNPDAPDETFEGLSQEYLLEAKLHDEAIDLTHSIEANADAEYVNAYEIPFKICHMDLPRDLSPCYYPGPEELTRAKLELELAGFSMDKPIIALHLKASARNRTYGGDAAHSLVSKLVGFGCQVIILGDDRLGNYTKAPAFSLPAGSLPFRISAAVLALCRAAVTVDSAFLHLAQALKVPQVALFGSFDANLRMKHFTDCIAIQGTRRCSPCHLHIDFCSRMEEEGYSKLMDAAPCMTLIPPQVVADNVLEVLKETAGSWEPGQVGTLVINEVVRPADTAGRYCPFCHTHCGSTSRNAGFKAGIAYKVCKNCESVVAINPPEETKTYSDYSFITRMARLQREVVSSAQYISSLLVGAMERKGRLMEVGAGAGFNLVEYINQGWLVMGIEKNEFLVKHGQEKLGLQSLACGDFEEEELVGDVKYDAVLLNETVERAKNPESVVEKALGVLAENGVIAVLGVSADALKKHQYVQSPRLTTYYPGQNRQIASETGLEELMGKHGLERIQFHKSERNETFVALYKRRNATLRDIVYLVPKNEALKKSAGLPIWGKS